MGEFHCDDCCRPKGKCIPICLKFQEERRYSEGYKRELARKSALLSEWIAAAQSAPFPPGFGRMLQEPTPKRLQEAIAQAVSDQQELAALRTAVSKLLDWGMTLETCSEKSHGYVLTCVVRNRLRDLMMDSIKKET